MSLANYAVGPDYPFDYEGQQGQTRLGGWCWCWRDGRWISVASYWAEGEIVLHHP